MAININKNLFVLAFLLVLLIVGMFYTSRLTIDFNKKNDFDKSVAILSGILSGFSLIAVVYQSYATFYPSAAKLQVQPQIQSSQAPLLEQVL